MFSQNTISFQTDYLLFSGQQTASLCYELEGSDLSVFSGIGLEEQNYFGQPILSLSSTTIDVSSSVGCVTVTLLDTTISTTSNLMQSQLGFTSLPSNVQVGAKPIVPVVVLGTTITGQPDSARYLIKGFDNNVDQGFSISLINMAPIKQHDIIGITNSNYLNDQGWQYKTNRFEYIEFTYTGIETIPKYSTLCIRKHKDSGGTTTGQAIELRYNGNIETNYTVNDQTDTTFLTGTTWTNVYVYNKAYSPVSPYFQGVSDGLTFGINKTNYGYDIPFEDTLSQLFFFDTPGSQYAYIDCSQLDKSCSIWSFLKNKNYWIHNLGTVQNELLSHEVCLQNCDFRQCDQDSLVVEQSCLGRKMDIIYLMDESGSISDAALEDMKASIGSSSNKLKCLIEDVQFAFCTFESSNSFEIVQNFQSSPLDVMSYTRNCSPCLTDVTDAYRKLLESIATNTLLKRVDSELLIILMTDAPESQMDTFTYVNALKSAPYNGKQVVVCYVPTIEDYPNTAAYASRGGPYNGIVTSNAGDPEGHGKPRHLYLYDNFTNNLNAVLSGLHYCDTVRFAFSNETVSYEVSTTLMDSCVVLDSISPLEYITNQKGTIGLHLTTNEGCNYNQSYTYTNSCIDGQNPLYAHVRKERAYVRLTEAEREESRTSEGIHEVTLYPIPTKDRLLVRFGKRQAYELTIYTGLGEEVSKRDKGKHEEEIEITTTHLSSGVYYIKFEGSSESEVFFKKFIVVQ